MTSFASAALSRMRPLILGAAFLLAAPAFVAGDEIEDAFLSTLAADERKEFEDHRSANIFHEFKLDAYWRKVSNVRALRKGKRKRGEALTDADYVQTFPPDYKGPKLSASLAKRWEDHQKANAPKGGAGRPIPPFSDALAHAKTHYDFEPDRVSEREFKSRYAREALRLGVTKEQVLRVYGLETGGQGTADMQSGVHPITKQGKPISSAIGYAQLLHANSVDEIDNHGDKFVARLKEMAASADLPADRRAALKRKADSLRRMVANARTVSDTWDAHVAYANTPRGMGIHAVNADGDIGPWLQVIKLVTLKKTAAKAGLPELTGAEMELMNLAGPGTGLEMMKPAGLKAPTTNFFTRQAYGRNTVVRGRTSKELMEEMDRRMDFALTKPGAIEFAAAFDELIAQQRAER